MDRRTFFAGLTALIAHAVGASPARGEVYIPLVRKDGGPGPSPTNTAEPSVTPNHTPEPSATASESRAHSLADGDTQPLANAVANDHRNPDCNAGTDANEHGNAHTHNSADEYHCPNTDS